MKRIYITLLVGMFGITVHAQELFVFTEPASNMPAHSLSPRFDISSTINDGKLKQRYTPEVMFGFSSKFMFHIGTTFSNMYSDNMRWESVYMYSKYRFLSNDEVHKHFRMAGFAEATWSRNPYTYDEVNIQADRSGVQLGIIATQLINKLAFSGSISTVEALDASRFDKVLYVPARSYQALDYSLSAGILLLPKEYVSYHQLNMNFYTELLGQRSLDRKTYYVDLAPSIQFIFNSIAKLNVGYRFQLSGNQTRNSRQYVLVAFEYAFLNALKK